MIDAIDQIDIDRAGLAKNRAIPGGLPLIAMTSRVIPIICLRLHDRGGINYPTNAAIKPPTQ